MLNPVQAAPGQVLHDGLTTVLLGNYVIDLEWRRIESLRHPAIFAAAFGATPHQFDERLVHGTPPQNYFLAAFLRARLALAWRMPSKPIARPPAKSSH